MLVLFVELEYLQNPRTGVFEQIARFGFAHVSCRNGAEGGERFVQFAQQLPFAIYEFAREWPLVLPKEAIFLQCALMEFITELLVLMQGFGRSH